MPLGVWGLRSGNKADRREPSRYEAPTPPTARSSARHQPPTNKGYRTLANAKTVTTNNTMVGNQAINAGLRSNTCPELASISLAR